VHIQKFHSVDILVIHLLGIIFWFNPAIKIYKTILNQLHEFEADEHAVEDRDLYSYCRLLTKLTLPSSEFSLANHFNNNLTVQRIAMMKRMKGKIQAWKMLPVTAATGLFFFAIACQDQVANDLRKMAQNTTMTELFPVEVKTYLEKLKRANPNREYIVLENTPEGKATIDKLWKNSFTYSIDTSTMHSVNVYSPTEQARSFTILQKGVATNTISAFTSSTDHVYTIVEEMASPQNGMIAFQEYLTKNILYPDSARRAGIEGKVFIEFVVNIDGRLSDFQVLKGIKGGCNEEAVRVLSASPAWKPARQEGVAVKQRMVMPITYNLSFAETVSVAEPTGQNEKMDLAFGKDNVNGKIRIEGTVWRRDGKPLAGAHIILKNSTEGTTTGADGHFKFETTTQQGTLVFSFVGFNSEEHQF
jgi:TonB family protein